MDTMKFVIHKSLDWSTMTSTKQTPKFIQHLQKHGIKVLLDKSDPYMAYINEEKHIPIILDTLKKQFYFTEPNVSQKFVNNDY